MRAPFQRRHWIFDLDGTLTEAVHDYEGLRNQLGLPSGSPILEAIAVRPHAQQAALLEAVASWERAAVEQARAAPGAEDLLKNLVNSGILVGILTRNLKSVACATLERCGLAGWFPAACILGREEAAPKPHPDGILRLLAHWGAAPVDGVMVGDYLHDLEAGRRAGVLTVHVGGGRGWPEWTDWQVERLDLLVEPTS